MKGLGFGFIILLLCAVSVNASAPWSFRLSPKCTLCIEGLVVNTTLVVTNTGNAVLNITQLVLIDADGIPFFTSPMEGQAGPGDSLTINFPLHLPPATRGSTLFYKPCIQLPSGLSCADNFARIFVKPVAALECTEDKECAEDEVCSNFKCVQFPCEGNAINHHCQLFNIRLVMQIATVALLVAITLLLSFGRRPRY